MKTDGLNAITDLFADMSTGQIVGVAAFYAIALALMLLWRPVVTLVGIAAVFVLSGFDIAASFGWLVMLLPIGGFVAFIGLLYRKAMKGKKAPAQQQPAPVQKPDVPMGLGFTPMPCGYCAWDPNGVPQYNRRDCLIHGAPQA